MKSTTTQQSTPQDSITSYLGKAVIASGCLPREGGIGDDIDKALEAILRDHFDSDSFAMAVLYPDDAAISYVVIDESALKTFTLSRARKVRDTISASQDRHQEITGSPHRITVTRLYSDEFDYDLIIHWADLSDEGFVAWLGGNVLRDADGEFLSLNLYGLDL
jgi:hypothetical protein